MSALSKGNNSGVRRGEDDSVEIEDAQFARRVTDLIERGLERYSAGDVQGALSEWEHAIALDPECHRAVEYAAYARAQFMTDDRLATIRDTPMRPSSWPGRISAAAVRASMRPGA